MVQILPCYNFAVNKSYCFVIFNFHVSFLLEASSIDYTNVFSRVAFLYQGFRNIWGKMAETFAKAMLNDYKPLCWAAQEMHIFLSRQWSISRILSILLGISSRTLIPVILQRHFLWQLKSLVHSSFSQRLYLWTI